VLGDEPVASVEGRAGVVAAVVDVAAGVV